MSPIGCGQRNSECRTGPHHLESVSAEQRPDQ
jgi:hypothetical protein